MTKILSKQALAVIEKYKKLPIGGKKINCPYFVHRNVVRGLGLRALIGKGSPDEIVDEVIGKALRQKINLEKLSAEEISRFVENQKIGVDCSGFVYHVLDAELKARGKGSLKKHLSFPLARNSLLGVLVKKMRPAENANVATFAHQNNSREINLKEILPGDLVVMMGESGKNLNHVLIITKVDFENNLPGRLYFAHSRLNYGISEGTIEIVDINKNLLEQNWIEEKDEGDNSAINRARNAERISLRKLSFF